MRFGPPGSFAAAVALAALVACGNPPSPPPTPSPSPNTPEPIRGNERLGWNQPAGSTSELATFQFAIYVDNARGVMADVSCSSLPDPVGFACSGRMPALTPGQHTLELAAFMLEGGTVVESPRSAPLQVTVSPASMGPAGATPDGDSMAVRRPPAPTIAGRRLVDGLRDIADLALTTDGRLLIVERAGAIRVVRDGVLDVRPALLAGDAVLSVALDPAFSRTRIVYVLQAGPGAEGDDVFRLVRYREAGGAFGERAVLLDNLPAGEARPMGTVRVGVDRKLYLALSDPSGHARERAGRLLRLNLDGTTPRDQPRANPIVAAEFQYPRGFDWDPRTSALWIADASAAFERVWAVAREPDAAQVGAATAEFRFAPGTGVWAVAFYRSAVIPALGGSLLVASDSGLLRVAFDPRDPSRITGVDTLLEGPVRGMVTRRDGHLYVATDSSILLVGAAARER